MSWTDENKKLLADLIEQKVPTKQIAKIIGKSAGAVRAKASDMNISISPDKEQNINLADVPDIPDMQQIQELQKKADVLDAIQSDVKQIKIPKPSFGNEATAFAIASDWHFEENIHSASVMGYNEYNLDRARDRSTLFFSNALKLTDMFSRDIKINTLVVAFLGDLMSGYIHEELLEENSLSPTETVIELKRVICNGIEYLLKNSKYNLIIPCAIGNHGRTTIKKRVATSHKNSYEWLLYHQIKDKFKENKRVQFLIPDSYFVYLTVYDKLIRFHHGDYIRYGGGVGGITIPVNKAIAQWDKLQTADLDVFGHFHQYMITKKFVANGSLIGYSPYAMSIKAEPEKAQQAFFLYDNKHGKTVSCPIFLE